MEEVVTQLADAGFLSGLTPLFSFPAMGFTSTVLFFTLVLNGTFPFSGSQNDEVGHNGIQAFFYPLFFAVLPVAPRPDPRSSRN